MRPFALISAVALALICSHARADDEAPNTIYVQSGESGRSYAKSIPADLYGSKGTTRIYLVREKEDELAFTFDWYAPQIVLRNVSNGLAVIRIGSWPRGDKANSDELAIAFYLNGKLLRSYSTLDIAGKPDNVSTSNSHYTVIKKHLSLGKMVGGELSYEIETIDGRTISFNIATGELIAPPVTTKP